MKNLVLIGMPGSGKTKLSQILSRRFGLTALDTDQMVEEAAGLSIPEIFEQFGEEHFRQLETQACQKAARAQRAVIATGGGAILREENMTALAETGVIFFRDRDPNAIVKENHGGRPLLAEDSSRVFRLYETRYPLYLRYAHHHIPHTDTLEAAAEQIALRYEAALKSASSEG